MAASVLKYVRSMSGFIRHREGVHLCVRSCATGSAVSSPGPEKDAKHDLVEERFFDKINIKVKGYDHPVLSSYVKFVSRAARNLDIDIHGAVALPTKIKKYTVLKSPHIYKKHRVQFEIRTHSRLLQIKKITGTTADIFLEYIQRNLPEGVSMAVYQEALEALPKLLLEPPSKEDSKKGKKTK